MPQKSHLSVNDEHQWRRLYNRAFAEFGTSALWNLRQLKDPTPRDALAAARQLRVEGDLDARRLAERLELSARAHL
jgi:hypothetical protein